MCRVSFCFVGATIGRPRTPAAMASLPGGYGIRPYGVGVDARHRPGRAAAAARPAGGQWPPLQSPLGPPLRGGSARRRWGRELYGCPKYFGLWQGSLPPPLRGTAPPLAQAPPPPYRGSLSRRGRSACQKTSTFLYRECRGDHWSPASLAQQRAFRDGFLTRHTGTGEQCSPLQEFFDRLTSLAEGGFISSKVM